MENTRNIENRFQAQVNFFLNLTTSHQATLQWLRENELLPSRRTCCNELSTICRNSNSIDGEMFRCTRCGSKENIREGTRWQAFRRVPLVLLVRLIFYYYANEYSARRAFDDFAAAQVEISYATVKRVYCMVRNSVADFMILEVYEEPLRGRVQVDEALFTHRAGPGRRGLRQVWVVGFLEEATGEAFCFVVNDRNSRTINQLIVNHCHPGTYLIHDGWQGYSRIPHIFQHHRFLKGRDDPDNTPRIEGVWGEMRGFLRNIYSAGVVETNVRMMIQELVWRGGCRDRGFELSDELIEILREI